ncbi:hypothetical protein BpHYR1_034145 [Brachionus plicatilis]|uniref:Uncharacterized protein n=1 Tax=Brachionus plicatilis TaxID=10195 RepID=A0A3M7S679_BRAPC|nr:hypothetical protein BpHYR1_034145 [Brachionus plicatilis]
MDNIQQRLGDQYAEDFYFFWTWCSVELKRGGQVALDGVQITRLLLSFVATRSLGHVAGN